MSYISPIFTIMLVIAHIEIKGMSYKIEHADKKVREVHAKEVHFDIPDTNGDSMIVSMHLN